MASLSVSDVICVRSGQHGEDRHDERDDHRADQRGKHRRDEHGRVYLLELHVADRQEHEDGAAVWQRVQDASGKGRNTVDELEVHAQLVDEHGRHHRQADEQSG